MTLQVGKMKSKENKTKNAVRLDKKDVLRGTQSRSGAAATATATDSSLVSTVCVTRRPACGCVWVTASHVCVCMCV